ncbi:YitT family protein [Carnobacterium antarcticum]|uniref:YitT family protein n=1 Tax=Carnobacterium antarcticum TaxID=2126436 RepID=A0ABW4NMT9_9LACT|nr:YitT family protein [Carnobacterium sp. CP1]ALV20972.1 membrane protein [Carnobacterium sp. CP1]
MIKLKTPNFWLEQAKKIFFVLFASITNAIALNNFLIPSSIYAPGVNGISQLLAHLTTEWFHLTVDTGIFILLINIPIALLGWFKIGKDFTLYSFLTSLMVSFFTIVLPISPLTTDPIMNALFGGVIGGAGIGFALKYGFSTGGIDIISMVLAKTTGRSVGSLLLAINCLIVIAAGFLNGWQYAMYTLLSIYVMTRVVDMVHTSHQKVTAMIVTNDPDALIKAIHAKLIRGITVIPATGGYTGIDRSVLMIVISNYEMYELEQAVKEADAAAFVNFMGTNKVLGEFLSSDQQKARRDNS